MSAETLAMVRRALGRDYDHPDLARCVRDLRRDLRYYRREFHALTERWDAAQAYLQHDPECDYRACLGCDDVARDCHTCPGYPCTCGLSELLGEGSLMTEETSDE